MNNLISKKKEIKILKYEDLWISKNLDDFTYQQTKHLKEEIIWQNLAGISLNLAIEEWLSLLSPLTSKNYRSGIAILSKLYILNLTQSLQEFSQMNHDLIIDRIKKIPNLSEATKQARAALYISLTRFLSRRTEGFIKRANPCKEGTINTTKTFGAVRNTVKSEALSKEEWTNLISTLELINPRDALIVKLCLQGAKRIREVLSLTIDKINFEKLQANFKQLKTKGIVTEIIVNFPVHMGVELKNYIGGRTEGPVFITTTGKAVTYTQIYEALKRAARKLNMKKNIHPHVLRCSAITYHRSAGMRDYEILRLTGHSSTQMLNLYDKTSKEENASRIALI
jgi:integrase/recombinase XerD